MTVWQRPDPPALPEHDRCIACGCEDAPWDSDVGAYLHPECGPDGGDAA